MKLRFSFLNLLLLLMFWGPAFFYIAVMALMGPNGPLPFDVHRYIDYVKALTHPSTLDDYCIHLLGMLSAPLALFLFLSVVYIFFDWWARLNYWARYGLLLGLYVVGYNLVVYFAFLFMEKYETRSSCPGGSPILFLGGLFLFYVPIGFIVTLIARIVQDFRSPPYE